MVAQGNTEPPGRSPESARFRNGTFRQERSDFPAHQKGSKVPKTMLVVHVTVRVKPEWVEEFKAATLANAQASITEAGIARFDLAQLAEDPTRFVLVEAYRTADAPAAHKLTPHYAVWRDKVAEIMAEPRTSMKYQSLFPPVDQW
jgi:autoinducer 2-degrading protein